MSKYDNKITIYVPLGMKAEMEMLPDRSVSRICQRAIREEIDRIKRERAEEVTEMFEED